MIRCLDPTTGVTRCTELQPRKITIARGSRGTRMTRELPPRSTLPTSETGSSSERMSGTIPNSPPDRPLGA